MWTIMAADQFVVVWSDGKNHSVIVDFWIRPKCNISSSTLSSSGHTYESVCVHGFIVLSNRDPDQDKAVNEDI